MSLIYFKTLSFQVWRHSISKKKNLWLAMSQHSFIKNIQSLRVLYHPHYANKHLDHLTYWQTAVYLIYHGVYIFSSFIHCYTIIFVIFKFLIMLNQDKIQGFFFFSCNQQFYSLRISPVIRDCHVFSYISNLCIQIQFQIIISLISSLHDFQ
jgi:hypothetical protein